MVAEIPSLVGYMLVSIDKWWPPGAVLDVGFLDGEDWQHERVEAVAQEWSEYANITLAFRETSRAAIRVSFDTARGSWSYIGQDACHVEADQATVNLGWLISGLPDEDANRVILHEFGHVLGCFHEHQSPETIIPWDPPRVYEHFGRLGLSKAAIDEQILAPLDPTTLFNTRFDPESIMIYAVDNDLTVGDFCVGWNSRLSSGDKRGIRVTYPVEEPSAMTLEINGAPVSATIGAHEEVDLFVFDTVEAGWITVETEGPTDVVLSLHGPNSASTLVGADNDSGKEWNARVMAHVSPGRYYVRVRHRQPSGRGDYRVGVTQRHR